MKIREAQVSDIPALQIIRHAVTENTLSDPRLVMDDHYIPFITQTGKGWVAEGDESMITGFAIIDLEKHNVWALFIHPDFQKKGIGKALHGVMIDWYFDQTDLPVRLSTGVNTRAETFYSLQGWSDEGIIKKERCFQLTLQQWKSRTETLK